MVLAFDLLLAGIDLINDEVKTVEFAGSRVPRRQGANEIEDEWNSRKVHAPSKVKVGKV